MSLPNSSSKPNIDKSLNNSIALDLSNHNLNNSSSKQKFSFPKASRFNLSKSMYNLHTILVVIPSTMFLRLKMADQHHLATE